MITRRKNFGDVRSPQNLRQSPYFKFRSTYYHEKREKLIMPRGTVDASMLEAALIGFQQMRRSVEEKISELRRQLVGSDGTRAAQVGSAPRRTLSAAARRRIGAAQRKRWASFRGQAKAVAPKRMMSAAARKKIGAVQRKRWAVAKAKVEAAVPKRTMSKAARKKIAAAQRKRWAA